MNKKARSFVFACVISAAPMYAGAGIIVPDYRYSTAVADSHVDPGALYVTSSDHGAIPNGGLTVSHGGAATAISTSPIPYVSAYAQASVPSPTDYYQTVSSYAELLYYVDVYGSAGANVPFDYFGVYQATGITFYAYGSNYQYGLSQVILGITAPTDFESFFLQCAGDCGSGSFSGSFDVLLNGDGWARFAVSLAASALAYSEPSYGWAGGAAAFIDPEFKISDSYLQDHPDTYFQVAGGVGNESLYSENAVPEPETLALLGIGLLGLGLSRRNRV